MRRNALISSLIAISLALISTAAFSQPHGRGHERGKSHHHRDFHHDKRPQARHDRHDRHFHHAPKGARPMARFHRGKPLPRAYHHRHYVVHHWHHHHLRRPPHGHHWVRVGGDYLLVAIATGIIVDILISR